MTKFVKHTAPESRPYTKTRRTEQNPQPRRESHAIYSRQTIYLPAAGIFLISAQSANAAA